MKMVFRFQSRVRGRTGEFQVALERREDLWKKQI